jgi:hypothetical protein
MLKKINARNEYPNGSEWEFYVKAYVNTCRE